MSINFFSFEADHHGGESATRPIGNASGVVAPPCRQ